MKRLPSLTGLYRSIPPLYVLLVSLYACVGYLAVYMIPLITASLVLSLPVTFFYADTGSASFYALIKTIFAAGFCLLSYDQYRQRCKQVAGYRLDPEQFPELWKIIQRHVARYPGAKVNRVVLGTRFDIDLVPTPDTGFTHPYQNTLVLGLPMLISLGPNHISALIARKVSLLPRLNNWPLGWIYHCRRLWLQYTHLEESWFAPSRHLLTMIFKSYAVSFDKVSLHATRMAELQADKLGMAAIDASSMEEAITAFTLRKFFVENKLWPAIMRMSQKFPQPPVMPHASMDQLLKKELDSDRAHRLLDKLLATSASSYELTSTPPLKQRWANIAGNRPRIPLMPADNAATILLAEHLPHFLAAMDKTWLRNALPKWRAQFEKSQRDGSRLQQMIDQLPKDILSNEDIWESTVLVKRYMGAEKAAEFYKALLTTGPNDAQIYFKVGSFLIECRDRAGIKALEKAMAMDRKYTTEVCELISGFMEYTGERRAARTYKQRAVHFGDT